MESMGKAVDSFFMQRSFQNSPVIDTGLSDYHKMTVTALRSNFQKAKPKIIMSWDYKEFSNNKFRSIINTKHEICRILRIPLSEFPYKCL